MRTPDEPAGGRIARAAALAAGLLCALATPALAQGDAGEAPDAPRDWKREWLLAPLRVASNAGFHALVFVPPLESAWILPPGRGRVALFANATRTDLDADAPANRFRGTYGEVGLEATLALDESIGPVEIRLGVSAAELQADRGDLAASFEGQPLVTGDRDNAFRARRALLGVKLGALRAVRQGLDLAVTGWGKAPLDGEDDLVDSGGVEGAAGLVATQALRIEALGAPRLYLHAFIGGTWRQDQEAFDGRVRPNGGAAFAFGFACLVQTDLAVLVQAQVHGNPWRKMAGFSEDPASAHAGFRWRIGDVTVEAALGAGLTDEASAEWTVDAALTYGF